MNCATSIGYEDALSYGEGEKKAAQGCVWIAPESITTEIYSRILPFLPEAIKGKTVAGLNRRLRFYRYTPENSEYRPHVDGAWPPSSIEGDVYQFDSSAGKQWSCFTCLIYLNQGFEGGSTSFFWPEADGGLAVRGVTPAMGSIVVFPHGDNGTLKLDLIFRR
jgi:hypothetical protein